MSYVGDIFLLVYFANQLTYGIGVCVKSTLRFLGGLKLKNVVSLFWEALSSRRYGIQLTQDKSGEKKIHNKVSQ